MDQRSFEISREALDAVEACLRQMDAMLDGDFSPDTARTMLVLRRDVAAKIVTANALVESHICCALRAAGSPEATALEAEHQDAVRQMRNLRVDIQTDWPMAAAIADPDGYRRAVRSITKTYFGRIDWQRATFLPSAKRLLSLDIAAR